MLSFVLPFVLPFGPRLLLPPLPPLPPLLLLPPLPPPLVATICSGRAQGTSATSRFAVYSCRMQVGGNAQPSRFAHFAHCDGVYRYHRWNCRTCNLEKDAVPKMASPTHRMSDSLAPNVFVPLMK